MRLSYAETARIARNMSSLLKSGVPSDRLFIVLERYQRSRRAREALEVVRQYVTQGRMFYEGFAARPRVWPRYFIELVRCAEVSGQLYAGFEEAADHFEKMAKTWRAANMLWISPVAILLLGWIARGLLWTFMVDVSHGLQFFGRGILTGAPTVAVIVAFVYLPPLRTVLDSVFLGIPLVAETARDLALYQFTKCFQLLYIGALSAPEIVRLSAQAVGNRSISKRLASAVGGVQQGSTFSDALGTAMSHWPTGYIESLGNAEEAGQLERVLDQLAAERKEALETRVTRIRQISDRVIGLMVAFAIAYGVLDIGNFLVRHGRMP